MFSSQKLENDDVNMALHPDRRDLSISRQSGKVQNVSLLHRCKLGPTCEAGNERCNINQGKDLIDEARVSFLTKRQGFLGRNA